MSVDIVRSGLRTPEDKNNLANPELLTLSMRAFWQEAGQVIGKEYDVSNLLLTGREIKKELENGRIYLFHPAGVSREYLRKMFPEMRCWAVEENNQIDDLINNSGWFSTKASIDAPHLGTTEEQLEEIFRKQGEQGDSLSTYIIRGQFLKRLTGRYPDQGSTWSKLLNCCYQGKDVKARFRSDGSLEVNLLLNTHPLANVGGRSVKWIHA